MANVQALNTSSGKRKPNPLKPFGAYLESEFEKCKYPTMQSRQAMSFHCSASVNQVSVWFMGRRKKAKLERERDEVPQEIASSVQTPPLKRIKLESSPLGASSMSSMPNITNDANLSQAPDLFSGPSSQIIGVNRFQANDAPNTFGQSRSPMPWQQNAPDPAACSPNPSRFIFRPQPVMRNGPILIPAQNMPRFGGPFPVQWIRSANGAMHPAFPFGFVRLPASFPPGMFPFAAAPSRLFYPEGPGALLAQPAPSPLASAAMRPNLNFNHDNQFFVPINNHSPFAYPPAQQAYGNESGYNSTFQSNSAQGPGLLMPMHNSSVSSVPCGGDFDPERRSVQGNASAFLPSPQSAFMRPAETTPIKQEQPRPISDLRTSFSSDRPTSWDSGYSSAPSPFMQFDGKRKISPLAMDHPNHAMLDAQRQSYDQQQVYLEPANTSSGSMCIVNTAHSDNVSDASVANNGPNPDFLSSSSCIQNNQTKTDFKEPDLVQQALQSVFSFDADEVTTAINDYKSITGADITITGDAPSSHAQMPVLSFSSSYQCEPQPLSRSFAQSNEAAVVGGNTNVGPTNPLSQGVAAASVDAFYDLSFTPPAEIPPARVYATTSTMTSSSDLFDLAPNYFDASLLPSLAQAETASEWKEAECACVTCWCRAEDARYAAKLRKQS